MKSSIVTIFVTCLLIHRLNKYLYIGTSERSTQVTQVRVAVGICPENGAIRLHHYIVLS
jgi:hypothetical protein